MAADHTGTALRGHHDVDSDDLASSSPERGCNIPKRHARVTVKYNRKELQRRLDMEKWIENDLGQLYAGQVGGTCEEQTEAALILLFKRHVYLRETKHYTVVVVVVVLIYTIHLLDCVYT